MVTREDIIEKLSEKTLLEDAAVDSKIQNILNYPTLVSWIEALPVIPDLLLTLLGFRSLEELVTQNFVWEYWSKALVEEHNDFPDVTEISELATLEAQLDRSKEFGLKLPLDSIKDLRRAYRVISNQVD